MKAKQARDDFFTLLELSPELKTGTRYSKASAMFDDEPRWKVSTPCEWPPDDPRHMSTLYCTSQLASIHTGVLRTSYL